VVANQMTPHPPKLSEAVSLWDDAELFYILKHGIKFAGMPAWAAEERDSGIWPVVAFLRALPEMDGATYQELVFPDLSPKLPNDAPELVSRKCAACHGFDGNGRTDHGGVGGDVALLAGQTRDYLVDALTAYRNGTRYSGVMQPIAANLRPDEIASLADYFSTRTRQTTIDSQAAESVIAMGKELALRGNREDKIGSCVSCHGPGDHSRSSDYPDLVGQPAQYTMMHLRLFQDRKRGGAEHVKLMYPIADKLSDKQIEALAAYYQSATPSK